MSSTQTFNSFESISTHAQHTSVSGNYIYSTVTYK